MNKQKRLLRHTRPFFPLFLFLFLGINLTAEAQIKWPPATPAIRDQILVSGHTINPERINCDMYNYGSGYLFGMVYDDVNTNSVHVVAYDVSGGLVTYTINNARHPDVAVNSRVFPAWNGTGYDFVGICDKAELLVVYEDLSTTYPSIKMDVIVVENLGNPMTYTGGYAITHDVSTGNLCKEPHIDMASGSNVINQCADHNVMEEIVVTWTENVGGVNKIYASSQTYITLLPFAFSKTYIDDGDMADVALSWDANASAYNAYFIYYNAASMDMKRADWDCVSATANTYPTVLDNGNVLAPPRIEASNALDPTTNNTYWQAVAEVEKSPGSMVYEIHGYDNTNNTIGFTNYSTIPTMPPMFTTNPLTLNSGYGPCVAVGNGPTGTSGNIGNTGYTVGWNIDNYELHPLLLSSSNTAAVIGGYEQINKTTLGGSYGPGKNLMALTNCSNDGSYLGAAWYNPTQGDIRIKIIGGSTFAFKPTNVNELEIESVSIFPNPASDILTVSGITDANYTVTDMTGRLLNAGTVTAKSNKINVNSLPVGIYMLRLEADGVTKAIKFTKE